MPKNIHISHFVVDGAVRPADGADTLDQTPNPTLSLNPTLICCGSIEALSHWEIGVRP
jgi:hypothetical protein